jgi:hypothetical protein
VGASDREGSVDASMEGVSLKRACSGRDVDDVSRQRVGLLRLCHLEVITEDPSGGT